METGCGPLLASHLQEGPFSCPICLDALKDPVTTPCGHNFCLSCLEAHRHHPAAAAGVSGGGQGTSRCPLCQEPFPADLQLRKNHTLAELLQFRQPASAAPRSPGSARMSPEEEASEPRAAEDNPDAGRPAGEAEARPAPRPEVLCDFCTGEERAEAAQSCLVCLASFCAPHLQPHLKSPAFQGHRLVPPLRRIEESLCKLHLKPLESFCRTDRSCICQLCRAQDHRSHEVVAVEVEREHVEAQRPKLLNSVENQLDELGVLIAQTRRTVDLIKGTAEKEKVKVSKLFAETAQVLAAFQKEVLGFIEDGERAMLSGAEEELRQKEERRATLTKCRQNLEKVPSTDTISFLQEFQALKIAAEEKIFPSTGFPKELSFIKSSQAVFAVKEVLGNVCKNYWDQLSGKGDDGPVLYGMPEGLYKKKRCLSFDVRRALCLLQCFSDSRHGEPQALQMFLTAAATVSCRWLCWLGSPGDQESKTSGAPQIHQLRNIDDFPYTDNCLTGIVESIWPQYIRYGDSNNQCTGNDKAPDCLYKI